MFANIAHHQHTHLFAHSPRYNNENYYKDPLSLPALGTITQGDRNHGLRSGDFRQRSQRPHYGPLRHRPPSTSRQKEQSSAPIRKGDASEHMLRRKTPTGTLAAGYDGRPVEWAGRPHAAKHFLMPMSTAVGEAVYQSLPTVEPTRQIRPRDCFSIGQEQGHIWYDTTVETMDNQNALPSRDLRSNLPQPAGLDSVLNQGSWSYPYGNLACEQRNPTVLQPMWPPSLSFTALNDTGESVPRWAGDGYTSHRLASFQAPYYCPQPIESRHLGTNHLPTAFSNFAQPKFNPEELNTGQNLGHQSLQGGIEREFAGNFLDQVENQRRPFPFEHGNCTPQHHQYPLVHRAKPRSAKPLLDRYASYRDNSPELRAVGHSVTPRDPTSNFAIRNDQSQFKEKVLIWAHRVYGSLVASSQKSRRNLRNPHHHSGRRLASSIYLKPPGLRLFTSAKDNTSDLRNIQSRDDSIRQAISFTTHHESQWQQGVGAYKQFPGDYATSTQESIGKQPHQGQDLRHQRQANGPQDAPSNIVSSVIKETVPAALSASSVLQHETSPESAATTALEILDRLCQESGWKWTEGMLLAGCLAYGLGDYGKAMNWCMRVLSEDSG